jgi:hypothetical protein
MSVRLVRQDEFRVTLSGVARAGTARIHPIHKIAVTVPDREDEDHAALKCLAHNCQTAECLGSPGCGVTVILLGVRVWQHQAAN